MNTVPPVGFPTSPPAETHLVVTETNDWEPLRESWRALAAANPATTIFQTWEWVSLWHRRLAASTDSCLLVVRAPTVDQERGGLLGIAPLLYTRRDKWPRKLSLAGGGDYLDVLATPQDRPEVMRAILFYLATNRQSWDIADFRSLRSDGVLGILGAPPEAHQPPERCAPSPVTAPCPGVWAVAVQHQRYPFVALPSSWAEFQAMLGKKLRSQLDYDVRRLRRDFDCVSVSLATRETVDADMEALFTLHQARWIRKGHKGAFSDPATRDFHRELAALLLQENKLRLYTLRIGDQAVAALECFKQGRSVCYYQGGFDVEYARYSPSKMLIAQAIRDAIAEGANEFDFLKGEEDAKRRWGSQDRQTKRLVLAPMRPLPWLALQGLRWQPIVKEWLRELKLRRRMRQTAKPPTEKGGA